MPQPTPPMNGWCSCSPPTRWSSCPTIRAALGGVSPMTAFRHLKRLGYRCSYNHKGRYYARHELARYDRFGLWSVGDIHFSIDGSLRKTVRRLVEQADAGATHQELQARLLRARAQHRCSTCCRQREVERERLQQLYVYFDVDAQRAGAAARASSRAAESRTTCHPRESGHRSAHHRGTAGIATPSAAPTVPKWDVIYADHSPPISIEQVGCGVRPLRPR